MELSRNQPDTLAYLYEVFLDLYVGEPFRYTELQAWMDLHDFPLTQSEIKVVRTLTRIAQNG